MAIPQSKLRELVLQLLYSIDTGRTEEQCSIKLLMKELQVARSAVLQALEKVSSIQNNLSEIDQLIAKTAHNYSFERIQNVEKNILRLAIFELTLDKDIPPKVAISEAMRLARKFATPESANFVNAILDNVYKTSLGEDPGINAIEETARVLEAREHYTSQIPMEKEI